MDRKEKTFDAVKMVREIRDQHYEQTKGMSQEERVAFYREKAQELRRQLSDQKENASA